MHASTSPAIASLRLLILGLLTFYSSLCAAIGDGKVQIDLDHTPSPKPGGNDSPTVSQKPYKVGDLVPITCLNRTIDTGEHIQDKATGQLQYVPFPVCKETGYPLQLNFGIEKDVNCTIDFITDELYHLLEFYVHNDAPLTCRMPSQSLGKTYDELEERKQSIAQSEDTIMYTPFIIGMTGMLQLSHLHIANNLNVLLHAAPKSVAAGTIDGATAYSVSPADTSRAQLQKIIIGDSLPLHLSVRWYPDTRLPPSWGGVGGHFFISTLVYCLLSAGASAAICVAYFRGVELPRRLRNYGRERLGINLPSKIQLGNAEANAGLVRYNGYGYGVGTPAGNGWGNGGKRD